MAFLSTILLIVDLFLQWVVWRRITDDQDVRDSRRMLGDLIQLTSEQTRALTSLESRITTIDWCLDSAEHDRRVYERMRGMVQNPLTHQFKIVTIFRNAEPWEVGDSSGQAIREYYAALESALAQRPGFDCERMVVMRGALGHDPRQPEQLLRDLMMARPDFRAHYLSVLTGRKASGVRGEILFFGDTGRLPRCRIRRCPRSFWSSVDACDRNWNDRSR